MNKNGFTMIELVVVMAIIAVLAAITVPFINIFVTESKVAQANSTAKNIYFVVDSLIRDYCSYNPALYKNTSGDLIKSDSLSETYICGQQFPMDIHLKDMYGTACVVINDYGNGVEYVTWTLNPVSPCIQVSRSDQNKRPPRATALVENDLVGCYPLMED